MKLKKLVENIVDREFVEQWLNNRNFTNYVINDDLSVDVNSNVDLSRMHLYSIPIQFGVVTGYFMCDGNRLNSLKGCPREVGTSFDCSDNILTSLEYSPKIIGGTFDCSSNHITSLKGGPREIGGDYYCGYNSLTTLDGITKDLHGRIIAPGNSQTSENPNIPAPSYVDKNRIYESKDQQEPEFFKTKKEIIAWLRDHKIKNYIVNDDLTVDVHTDVILERHDLNNVPVQFGRVNGVFNICRNNLTSLKGCPREVEKDFICDWNKIQTMEYSPKEVGRHYSCSDNKLESLEGVPREVGGDFHCSSCTLTSLKGAPREVGGSFNCSFNKLVDLKYAPKEIGKKFYFTHNSFNASEVDLSGISYKEIAR